MVPVPPMAHTLRLIDAAMRALGPHGLAAEHVFVLDRERSGPGCHRLVLARPRPIQHAAWFAVAAAGTRFYLDPDAELLAWSYAWIRDHPAAFQEELRVLFSSAMLVVHRGTRAIVHLLGPDGRRLRQLKVTVTQRWEPNCVRLGPVQLYPPLVP